MEENKNKNIKPDVPPEFDISEFGIAIKKFYKEKTRFAVYLTILIVLIIALIVGLIVINNLPFARNTYKYYLGGGYFTTNFNFLEFIGLGTGKPNVIGTCTPEMNSDETNIINKFPLSLCSPSSYFYVTSFKTLVIQYFFALDIISIFVFTLLSIKAWKFYYPEANNAVKGYIKGTKLSVKVVSIIMALIIIGTILGFVLNGSQWDA